MIEPNTTVDEQVQEDMVLLGLIAERDSRAYQAFYQKYSNLIYSTLSAVLNDHHDTEDVMQEVMVQLWNKAHLYEPTKGKPLTWLLTMARNRGIDRIRAKQRRSRLNEGFGQESKGVQPEFDESGHEQLVSKERDNILLKAVEKLNPDQRQAIELTYFSGLTQAEVAERLNEPLGTVKARIRRGVSRLETLVKSRLS